MFEVVVETDSAQRMADLVRRMADPVWNPVPNGWRSGPLKATAVATLGDLARWEVCSVVRSGASSNAPCRRAPFPAAGY